MVGLDLRTRFTGKHSSFIPQSNKSAQPSSKTSSVLFEIIFLKTEREHDTYANDVKIVSMIKCVLHLFYALINLFSIL